MHSFHSQDEWSKMATSILLTMLSFQADRSWKKLEKKWQKNVYLPANSDPLNEFS